MCESVCVRVHVHVPDTPRSGRDSIEYVHEIKTEPVHSVSDHVFICVRLREVLQTWLPVQLQVRIVQKVG